MKYASLFFSLTCFTCLSYAETELNSENQELLSDAYPKTPPPSESSKKPSGNQELGPHSMRASIRHIEGRGVGYGDGYTSLTGFFAPNPEMLSVLPFVDLRGHVFDNGKLAANAGFGLRGILGCWVFGGNAYYDYRNTKHHHYNQVSLGLEALNHNWEIRANGYLPVGRKTSHLFDAQTTTSANFFSFRGHNALLRETTTKNGRFEFAMKGVDTEVGFHILNSKDYDVFIGAGPYYFNFENKHAAGGRIRFAVKIFDYLTLEAVNSYDKVFHDIIQGQVSVNIPFGPRDNLKESKRFANCDRAYALNQRLIQDVIRQEIVVVDRKRKKEQFEQIVIALDPNTGDPWEFFFVNNTSSSDGTFESPYPTLVQAQNASGPNNIIYVYAGDGTTTGMDAGITLQDSQRLLGASTSHPLNTQLGQITIPAQSIFMPFITNITIGVNVITVANNNEISGLFISNKFGTGIANSLPSITNLNINNNVIVSSALVGRPIFLTNVNGSLQIASNKINEIGRSSSTISNTSINNANYTIQNNISGGDNDFIAIDFTDSSNIITTIADNNFENSGNNGIITINLINSSFSKPNIFSISNNVINSDSTGITISLNQEGNGVFNIAANQIFNGDSDGIDLTLFNSSKANLSVTNNSIHVWSSGINLSSDLGATTPNLNFFIGNNTIVADDGIAIFATQNTNSNFNGAVINNTISNYNNDTVSVVLNDSSIGSYFISGNTILASGGTGINMFGNGSSRFNGAIVNNSVNLTTNDGIDWTSSLSSVGILNISGNTITAPGGFSSSITTNDSSSTCLYFSNNFSNPQGTPSSGVYQFINNNPPLASFNVQPLTGNVGYITESGTTDVSLGGCP